MHSLEQSLRRARIVPVLTVDSVPQTLALGRALRSAGMTMLEITLRTPVALEALVELKARLGDLCVGAGTLKSEADVSAAVAAGADFAVSPGLETELARQAQNAELPLLPGIATASELMTGMRLGYRCFKLFPAEAVGGIELLKSLAAPFPEVTFCPTGGVHDDNLEAYLGLPNVICVGGSWMVPREWVEVSRWQDVESLARQSLDRVRNP